MNWAIAEKARQTALEIASQAQERASEATSAVAGGVAANPLLAALLLAGGVGAAGWGISKAIRDKETNKMDVKVDNTQQGRLMVTLPTRNPGDAETVLEIPFDHDEILTNPIKQRLGIDTRKRLRAEAKQRKRPRGEIYDTQVA